MASDAEMRWGVRVCHWGTYQFLQHIFILSLVLIAGVSSATDNELAKKDGTLLEGSFYDSTSGSPTGAEVADEDEETGDRNEESEESVLSVNDQELTSNVELKNVAPHTEKTALGGPGEARLDPAEARRRYEAQKAQEQQDRADFQQRYNQVVEEMKVASAAHQVKPKKSGIYSSEPTEQERLHREHREEVAQIPPSTMQRLLAQRQAHMKEVKDMREKYGKVIEELKKKLADREKRLAAGTGPRASQVTRAVEGEGRAASSVKRRRGVA